MEGNLLYSKSTDLRINLIWKKNKNKQKKHPHKISRIMFDQIFGYYGPAKFTYKIYYHH